MQYLLDLLAAPRVAFATPPPRRHCVAAMLCPRGPRLLRNRAADCFPLRLPNADRVPPPSLPSHRVGVDVGLGSRPPLRPRLECGESVLGVTSKEDLRQVNMGSERVEEGRHVGVSGRSKYGE